MFSIKMITNSLNDINLPLNFSWEETNYVTPPLNQKKSPLCWAYTSASMFSDRIRIKTKNLLLQNDYLSPDILAMCYKYKYKNSNQSEYIDDVLQYLVDYGAISANEYASNVIFRAKSKYRVSIYDDKYGLYENNPIDQNKASSYNSKEYLLNLNEKAIMLDLYLNGPVIAVIKICTDKNNNIYKYTNGIYGKNYEFCEKNDKYHSVIISGYGEKDGYKYWVVRNSWSEKFGMKGLMHIIRGVNYSDIESCVWAVEV